MKKSIKYNLNFSSKGNGKAKKVGPKFFVGDKEVSEYEYFGVDKNTTLEDLGPEPFDYRELGEWQHKKFLIKKLKGKVSEFELRTGRPLIGFQ